MKKSFLFLSFVLTIVLTSAQDISDVSQSSSGLLTVLDVNNNQKSSMYISNRDELCGFSSSIIVVKYASGLVVVYNQNFNQISSKYIGDSDRVKNVNGNNVLIKYKSGLVVT